MTDDQLNLLDQMQMHSKVGGGMAEYSGVIADSWKFGIPESNGRNGGTPPPEFFAGITTPEEWADVFRSRSHSIAILSYEEIAMLGDRSLSNRDIC
jgi:hypothetical protein